MDKSKELEMKKIYNEKLAINKTSRAQLNNMIVMFNQYEIYVTDSELVNGFNLGESHE